MENQNFKGKNKTFERMTQGNLMKLKEEWEKQNGRKFTQSLLSRESGIPASSLQGYFKGTSSPNSKNAQLIAKFFGVPIERIFTSATEEEIDKSKDEKIEELSKMVEILQREKENLSKAIIEEVLKEYTTIEFSILGIESKLNKILKRLDMNYDSN